MLFLASNNLPGLASNLASYAVSHAIDKLENKLNGKRAVRAGRAFTLFISSKDMNDIKFTKLLEDSGVLIDSNIKAVKHEIKK